MADTDTSTDTSTDFDPTSVAERPYYPPTPPSPLTQIVTPFAQRFQRFADLGSSVLDRDQTERQPTPQQTVRPIPQQPLPPLPPQHFIPNRLEDDQAERRKTPWAIEALQYNSKLTSSAFLPNQQQGYGVIGGAGRQLAIWGDPAAAPFARIASGLANMLGPVFDFYSGGAFGRGYDRATAHRLAMRREQYEMQHEQMIQAANNTYLATKKGLEPYEDVIAAYNAHAFGRSDAENKAGALKALSDLAQGDPVMANAIANGGLKGAEYIIQQRTAKAKDVLSGAVGIDSAVRERKRKEGVPDTDDWGKEGAGGLTSLPGGPAEEERKAAAAATTPASSYDEKLGNDLEIGPEGVRAAHEGYNTGKLIDAKSHKPENRHKVESAQGKIESDINRAAGVQDPNADPDELSDKKIKAIERIDPEMASTLKGLKGLQIDPNSVPLPGGLRQRVMGLMGKIYPNWSQNAYHQFQNVWNKEDSRANLSLTAVNRAATQIALLEAAINRLKIPEDSTVPGQVWNDLKTKGMTSDPQFAALNEPLRAFASEVILAMTNRVAVTPVKEFLREAPLTGGKAQLRTTVRAAAIGMLHSAQQKISSFQRETGLSGLPPAADPQAYEVFSAFERSNPNTGVFPKDAPPELLAIQPTKEQRSHIPRWLDKNTQLWEPMTKERWDSGWATIRKLQKENPNDPRLPGLLQEFGMRE